MAGKNPDIILNYLRKKVTIRIFISHAFNDYENYHIKEFAEYLERQKEISNVYFCEEQLKGNIDEWMLETVSKSQLLLFIATKESVFESPDCRYELELADKFSIPCIPIKGDDVEWSDLVDLKLARELGKDFQKDNLNNFYKDIYNYIYEFKRNINLIDKEKRQVGISKIYERFHHEYKELEQKIEILEKKINSFENKNH